MSGEYRMTQAGHERLTMDGLARDVILAPPVHTFSATGVDSTTFVDDPADGVCVLLYPPEPLGTVAYGLQLILLAQAVGIDVTSVVEAANAGFSFAVRDVIAQPSVMPARFYQQRGMPLSVTASFATPGQRGNFSQGRARYTVAGRDDYGNTISSGDALVVDLGFWINRPASNQSVTFGGQARYMVVVV